MYLALTVTPFRRFLTILRFSSKEDLAALEIKLFQEENLGILGLKYRNIKPKDPGDE